MSWTWAVTRPAEGPGSWARESLTPAARVPINCFPAATDEQWLVLALIDLVRKQPAASQHRWKGASIGLGILSALLAIGLVISLIYR